MSQKTLIDMAAARGAFICQSQSLNLFVADATYAKLTSMHFYAWKKGLKTGMYYLRTKPKATTQQFTIDPRRSKSNIIRTSPVKSQATPPETPKVPVLVDVKNEEDADEVTQEAVGCKWKPGCKTCSS